jgi:hypothetical protein
MWITAIVLGAMAGAIVLGAFGRLVMAALADALGGESNLSTRGVAQVVMVGGVLGALGGITRQCLERWAPVSPVARGFLVAFITFALSLLLWIFSTRAALRMIPASTIPTLTAVLVMYIVFGILLEWFVERVESGLNSRKATGNER